MRLPGHIVATGPRPDPCVLCRVGDCQHSRHPTTAAGSQGVSPVADWLGNAHNRGEGGLTTGLGCIRCPPLPPWTGCQQPAHGALGVHTAPVGVAGLLTTCCSWCSIGGDPTHLGQCATSLCIAAVHNTCGWVVPAAAIAALFVDPTHLGRCHSSLCIAH